LSRSILDLYQGITNSNNYGYFVALIYTKINTLLKTKELFKCRIKREGRGKGFKVSRGQGVEGKRF